MASGKKTFPITPTNAYDQPRNMLAGSDSVGNMTSAATLFDVDGNPVGVNGNALVVTIAGGGGGGNSGGDGTVSDILAEASLTSIAGAAGTPTDTGYAGGASGSLVAILKGLYARLTGTLTVSDAAAEASLVSIDAGTGDVGDVAYSGTGNGSIVSILKAVYSKLAGNVSVQDSTLAWGIGTPDDIVYSGGSGSVVALLKAIQAELAASPRSANTGGPINTPSTPLCTIDTTGFQSVAFQTSGLWTGTLFFSTSNDGVNWDSAYGQAIGGDIAPADNTTGPGMVIFPVQGRYLQISTGGVFQADSITGGVSWNTYLLSSPFIFIQSVAITADPNIPLPMGGVDPSGNLQRISVDQTGAIKPADASLPIFGSASIINSILFTLDTRGYNSCSIQLLGTWTGTVSFFASHDQANWMPLAGMGAAGGLPVTNMQINTLVIFPCIGRYVRAQLTAATSGTVQAIAYLRSEAAPIIPANQAVNVAMLGGGGLVTPNVAGMISVGGNIAPGNAPTAWPVLVSGVDSGSLVRRFLTDTAGAQVVDGSDATGISRRILTDVNGALLVRENNSGSLTGEGTLDTLNRILSELRQTNFLLKQLPVYIAMSTQNPDVYGSPIPDDETAFRDDPTLNNQ